MSLMNNPIVSSSLPASPAASAPVEESEDEDEYAQPAISDPLERYNRTIFKFNDSIYRNVMRPVARSYEDFMGRRLDLARLKK